jgi:hypothetical protein
MAIVGTLIILPAGSATAQTAPTCGPYVTLTPPFGQPGTVVSVNLFHFAPNDEVDIILRVTGDPVVATGTTDAEGRANILFTMPAFPGDRVAILATASPCYAAGAYFERRDVTPTPTRTPIPATATPPPATPTTPPATATTPATTPATPTRPAVTPVAPVAGSGSDGGFGSAGMNLALVGLALVIFCGAFAIWGSTRQLMPARAWRRRDRDDS